MIIIKPLSNLFPNNIFPHSFFHKIKIQGIAFTTFLLNEYVKVGHPVKSIKASIMFPKFN